MSEITDANALRGVKFKELMRKPLTWILILVFSVIAAVIGAIVGPAIAGGSFVVVFLLGVVITFFVADHRAAQAFYDAYAEARGLTRWDGKDLGGSTPLLRKGDKRRVDVQFTGQLAEGIEGSLALFTYIVESRDSKGNKTEVNYPFTLTMISLPETIQHLPDLRVQRQAGFKVFEKLEDSFRRSHERVTLESEAMRDRYEIFVRKEQDPIWVRRLFSPSFIVWLTEVPPGKFAFEVENGWLCAYVPKHRDSTEGFDEMIAVGTKIAARLSEEVGQTSPAVAHEDSPDIQIGEIED